MKIRSLLLQAVRASWLAKKKQARIDDVVDFLKNARDNDQYVESPTIRSRLDEMIVLLDQYTANGTYGRYFNSDEPSLRDDARMVVLELGGLEDRPSLLVAVMFSLIQASARCPSLLVSPVLSPLTACRLQDAGPLTESVNLFP